MTHAPGTFGPFVIKSIAGYSNLFSVILCVFLSLSLSLSLTLLKLLLSALPNETVFCSLF